MAAYVKVADAGDLPAGQAMAVTVGEGWSSSAKSSRPSLLMPRTLSRARAAILA